MTMDELKQNYLKYKEDYLAVGNKLEAAACDVCIMVFSRCERKLRRDKHKEFIKKWYVEAERLKKDFSRDEQLEDALLQGVIQGALVAFWQVCGLNFIELRNLVKYPTIRFGQTLA